MRKIYIICLLITLVVGSSFVNSVSYTDGGQAKITSYYPNPATSFINFEFSKSLDKGYTLQVYNFIGKKVVETNINSAKLTISLDNFFRGIYIFQVRDKNGKLIDSGKFQVLK